MSTYGPSYDSKIDGQAIRKQRETIKDFMLTRSNYWYTLAELETALHYPQASVSAQLRHMRKPQFGGYIVEKQRREGTRTWEYRALVPVEENIQMSLF